MKLAIMNTGGTISCAGDPLAPMSAKRFADACRQFIDPLVAAMHPDLVLHYVEDLHFPQSTTDTLDSTNIQPSDWLHIAGYIVENYARFDGWVVLHGTDSMAFTAAALPFLLSVFDSRGISTAALSKPIVLTGSQTPMFHRPEGATTPTGLLFNTDAFQNFCGAVAAAQTGIPEVCVYFHNRLYRGARVLKTDASRFDAFTSPNYPALAEHGVTLEVATQHIRPSPVAFEVSLDSAPARGRVAAQLAFVAENIDKAPVMPFKAFPAWCSFPGYPHAASPAAGLIAGLIDACVQQGVGGLILESYGQGNFPSGNPDHPSEGSIYRALAAADRAGVVIIDCTQVIAGVVDNSAYAAGAWLPEVGALSPADMTPIAAFAKLTVLLAAAGHHKWSDAEVKRLVQLDLIGEMRNVSRLDSRGGAMLLAGQSLTSLDGSATLINDPAAGPVLREASGKRLWQALEAADADDMPGRLVLQNDGALVFYSRCNAPIWSTDAGASGGAGSLLILEGGLETGDLALYIYDYARGVVRGRLYPNLTSPLTRQ